jgi:hypothetical protein
MYNKFEKNIHEKNKFLLFFEKNIFFVFHSVEKNHLSFFEIYQIFNDLYIKYILNMIFTCGVDCSACENHVRCTYTAREFKQIIKLPIKKNKLYLFIYKMTKKKN